MLLHIVAIFFVGRAFWNLATKHRKSDWGYAALGILVYFVCWVIGGVISYYSVSVGIFGIGVSLIGIVLGLLACFITYQILKKSWSRPKEVNMHTLDGGLIDPERKD